MKIISFDDCLRTSRHLKMGGLCPYCEMPGDYEICHVCNHDHQYEADAAYRIHLGKIDQIKQGNPRVNDELNGWDPMTDISKNQDQKFLNEVNMIRNPWSNYLLKMHSFLENVCHVIYTPFRKCEEYFDGGTWIFRDKRTVVVKPHVDINT